MAVPGGLSGRACPLAPLEVDLPITLGQFVKVAGFASTGGDAKRLVTAGLVRLNSRVETRRGRKLSPGDVVESGGMSAQVLDRLSTAEARDDART
jgi:ribosome-associated protein